MTIEEQANNVFHHRPAYARMYLVEGYTAGVNITMHRACEWLKELMDDVPERDWVDDKLKEFIKAIEEG